MFKLYNILKCSFMLAPYLISMSVAAQDSIYCPQNHGQVSIGMTKAQVLSACGEPTSKQRLAQPLSVKIPVLQLIYNVQGAQHAFYGVWSLPVGVDVGTKLTVEVINNKVSNVQINGEGANAFSICDATMIQIGDPVSKVYDYCGNPSLANYTFIKKPIRSENLPEVWIYQPDPYGSSISLTFQEDVLQQIAE